MMFTEPLLILGVLCTNIAVAEWLCRHSFCRHIGTSLMVIVLTAIVANLRLIPTSPEEAPIYGWLLSDVVRLAVFWILLQVSLRELLKAGLPMIVMFLVGSFGTLLGVLIGMMVISGADHFDGHHAGLAAMFTGTYTGGSVNFNAMAAEYEVSNEGALFSGAVVVDNVMTAVWMVICIAIPRGVAFVRRNRDKTEKSKKAITGVDEDTQQIHPVDIAILIALGAAAIGISNGLSAWTAELGTAIPSMLFLSVIALVIAQTPLAAKLRGTRVMGMIAVYLFLAVIGALSDINALSNLEAGLRLLVFVFILIGVHGLITFGAGAIFKVNRDIIAIASQANIGGGTSAMAIARSLGRQDLVLPAILVGSLGTAIGNFLGILAYQICSGY